MHAVTFERVKDGRNLLGARISISFGSTAGGFRIAATLRPSVPFSTARVSAAPRT